MLRTIDISAAIAKRMAEIEQLHQLRSDIQRLVDNANRSSFGKPMLISLAEWDALRQRVEQAIVELRVTPSQERTGVGRGGVWGTYGTTAMPPHWDGVTVK